MGVYVLIIWVGAVMLNNKMCSELKPLYSDARWLMCDSKTATREFWSMIHAMNGLRLTSDLPLGFGAWIIIV